MNNDSIGKILVVDDEVELKNILVESLSSHGYEAVGFNDGVEALALLRQQAFDVLLTDLMMPGIDGIELVRKSLEIDPNLVCIMMTGQGTIQTAVDAMKAGTFDYVLKPFRLRTVLPVLTRAMNTRQLRLENVQLREAVAIHELSETIAFTLDPKTVLSKLADAALKQSEADEVSVLLPTEKNDEFYVAVVRGEKRERLLGERVPFGESISSWVARAREPIILNGEVSDDRFVALWPRPDIRSSVSLPMLVANKLIGVLNLNVISKTRPFTLGQMKALSILAGTAAAALESASLYTQVREAEENYRSIFENAVEGIFRSTREGRFTTVNPAMARILGYESPEEMIGTVTDVTNQLYVNADFRAEAARLQKERGFVQGFQFEAYRKDGEKIWLSMNRRSVQDENGVELYREGSVEDITERKRAEEEKARLTSEIESQRERLDSLISSVPGVVWEAWGEPDAATQHIDFVSDFVEPMLGYSVAEWLSTPNFWLTIVHPDDREAAGQEAAASFAAGKNSRVEFRWMAKDGHAVWVESNYVVIKDREEHPIGLRGVTTDVSERKRAEAELHFQKTLLESQSEASIDGILVTSNDRKILSFNRRFVDLWGIRGDALDTRSDQAALQSVIDKLEDPEEFLAGVEYLYQHPHENSRDEIHLSDSRTFDRYTAPIKSAEDEYYGRVWFFRDITESKSAEKALRESEERYKGLIDSAFDGVLILRDRRIVSANRAYAEMFGFGVDEVVGRDVLDFTAPEYHDLVLAQIVRDQSTYESVGLRKDGIFIPIEVSGQVCLYEGKPARLAAVRDISERKRVEQIQARRAAHASFRADVSAALAMSHAPLRGTLELCAEAMVQHLGAAFARVWTLNREGDTLELQASAGMYTHIDGGHARVPVGKFKIGKIAEERTAHITNDVQNDQRVGDHKWAKREGMIAFAGHPLQVEDRVLGVMAMFSRQELADDTVEALASVADIVSQGIERKRAEAELRESEERYRDLVENAHDIIFSHDLEGNYTSVNRAGELSTGYNHEECLSLNIADTIAPEYVNKAREMMGKKLAGEKVTAYEVELLAKDGQRIAVEVNTKLILQDGVPVGVQGIARDVTERKLLEDQLRQSQKMEAIGQLAGGVAHDFNNLLTAINGYSTLALQRLEEDHPVKSFLEEVRKAGDRAANLTRQLLAFGRKQILQPLPINLNEVVTDMNKMLRRLIGEDIKLTAKLDPALKKIKADPGQIEQVLVNLIVNARDAMPQGGDLTIETATVELDANYANKHIGFAPGNYVMLAVSDTGTGMDQATQAKIFDPFFTTKEKGKGTGLGLSTVYGIVKQSGGSIWVYSELGRGTTFKVYLPQIESAAQKAEAVAAEAPAPSGSETILLVEDEDVVRGLAVRILEQAGYKVLEAARGEDAVRLCTEDSQPIDLLLTDVVMPETSGKEVADRIHDLRPGTKVLFMSGYTDEAIVHHGVLDSNIEFIQKPFTPAALTKKVRKVLDAELAISG